jgi:hypothetical protein
MDLILRSNNISSSVFCDLLEVLSDIVFIYLWKNVLKTLYILPPPPFLYGMKHPEFLGVRHKLRREMLNYQRRRVRVNIYKL